MTDDDNTLIELLRSQLAGNETQKEIERLVLAVAEGVGIAPARALSIAKQLSETHDPSGASNLSGMHDAFDNEPMVIEVPRLLINWGQDLNVGWQACPFCHLICPNEFLVTPRVNVRLDHRLDHDPSSEKPDLRAEGGSVWSFHIPFALTTNGTNCRPGHYLIRISVELPFDGKSKPSFFYSQIRLKVLDPLHSSGKTLEIEGDGHSLVNLQGRDLKRFDKVIVKGSGSAVLNVQESLFAAEADAATGAASDQDTADTSQYEYTLKPDSHRTASHSYLSTRFTVRDPRDSAMLVLEDGRQVILIARRKVKLGRSRENDIVIRFLPRSPANDELSRNISRTHVEMQLTDNGFEVLDLGSASGSMFDGKDLAFPQLLTIQDAEDRHQLRLASQLADQTAFCAELELFCDYGRKNSLNIDASYQVDWESLSVAPGKLMRTGDATGIHSVRIRRQNNLVGREDYVLVYSSTRIGMTGESAIVIPNTGCEGDAARLHHAGGCFWLQAANSAKIQIENQFVAQSEIVPLITGMTLKIGQTQIVFRECEQMFV